LAAIIVLSRTSPLSKSNPTPKPPPVPEPTNETITSRFVACLPEITGEINLELATATQVETFSKSSECVLWGMIDLGTSIVQIRVPVTYRYHLRLREPWRLEIRNQRVIVHAPPFRASLPPAIATNQLEKLSVRGWCRGGTEELMEKTQREITPTLCRYATDPRHLSLVRAQCRQSVAQLVKIWLEREGRWGRHGYTEIQVHFPEEKPVSVLPTLRLLQ
jgi:hypothetical protein